MRARARTLWLMLLVMTALVVVFVARPLRPDADSPALSRLEVNGSRLVVADTGEPFFMLGLDYLGSEGRLVGELWEIDRETVLEDLAEMRDLGANTVYIHLQITDFMRGPTEFEPAGEEMLLALVEEAESLGLYLGVVGLGVYRVGTEPAWLDELDEAGRWEAFADFWRMLAATLADERAVALYDLMNAPRIPNSPQQDWYLGTLVDVQFHQWLVRDARGRPAEEIGSQWVEKMIAAIREHDTIRPITLGTYGVPGAAPVLTDRGVHEQLDLVSPHLYPTSGEIDRALTRISRFDVGKPVVLAETFPLRTTATEWKQFLLDALPNLDGFVSQYDGRTIAELEAEGTWSPWLDAARTFAALAEELRQAPAT